MLGEIVPSWFTVELLPNPFAVVFAKLLNAPVTIYNCEPLIASVEVGAIRPAATFWI